MSDTRDSVITICLLDPLRGHPIQTWEFVGAAVITIGRAATNDVVLNDMLVSRMHGELRRSDDEWRIIPLGRNGIIMEGRAIAGEATLRTEAQLRLGSDGPCLEVYRGRKRNAAAPPLGTFGAALDEERKRGSDTNKTDNDVLKSLQQQARQLNQNRKPPGSD